MLNTDTVWRGREEEGHQRDGERERLSELLRGDERGNGEKELFDLWKHDILIIHVCFGTYQFNQLVSNSGSMTLSRASWLCQ